MLQDRDQSLNLRENFESMGSWVRFSDLPAPWFDKKILLNLGKAIRLDTYTAQRKRGKFARMCVELDLTKPLVLELEAEGQIVSVVYESMGLLCQKCGKFGHLKEKCGDSIVTERVEEVNGGSSSGEA